MTAKAGCCGCNQYWGCLNGVATLYREATQRTNAGAVVNPDALYASNSSVCLGKCCVTDTNSNGEDVVISCNGNYTAAMCTSLAISGTQVKTFVLGGRCANVLAQRPLGTYASGYPDQSLISNCVPCDGGTQFNNYSNFNETLASAISGSVEIVVPSGNFAGTYNVSFDGGRHQTSYICDFVGPTVTKTFTVNNVSATCDFVLQGSFALSRSYNSATKICTWVIGGFIFSSLALYPPNDCQGRGSVLTQFSTGNSHILNYPYPHENNNYSDVVLSGSNVTVTVDDSSSLPSINITNLSLRRPLATSSVSYQAVVGTVSGTLHYNNADYTYNQAVTSNTTFTVSPFIGYQEQSWSSVRITETYKGKPVRVGNFLDVNQTHPLDAIYWMYSSSDFLSTDFTIPGWVTTSGGSITISKSMFANRIFTAKIKTATTSTRTDFNLLTSDYDLSLTTSNNNTQTYEISPVTTMTMTIPSALTPSRHYINFNDVAPRFQGYVDVVSPINSGNTIISVSSSILTQPISANHKVHNNSAYLVFSITGSSIDDMKKTIWHTGSAPSGQLNNLNNAVNTSSWSTKPKIYLDGTEVVSDFNPVTHSPASAPILVYDLIGFVGNKTLQYWTPYGSLNATIEFFNPPMLYLISPAMYSTSGGEQITVYGNGFTGATNIKCNNYSVSYTIIDDTEFVFTSRTYPGVQTSTYIGFITLTDQNGIIITLELDKTPYDDLGVNKYGSLIVPPPIVSSISQITGVANGSIYITGSNFYSIQSITFGTKNATYSATTLTNINVIIPDQENGFTGLVTVTVLSYGGSATIGFTYL